MRPLIPFHFGLYAILTDPILGYETLAECIVEHTIPFLQLRMKDVSSEQILRTAKNITSITQGSKTLFIINDDPTLAIAANADGIHIGQDDTGYAEARALVGKDMIIGISTHNPQQTIDACSLKPDYIGIGPVYPTPTKKCADPAIGLAGLAAQLAVSTVPSVAIGGIDLINIRDVLSAGAINVCMVRQINRAKNPGDILKQSLELLMQSKA